MATRYISRVLQITAKKHSRYSRESKDKMVSDGGKSAQKSEAEKGLRRKHEYFSRFAFMYLNIVDDNVVSILSTFRHKATCRYFSATLAVESCFGHVIAQYVSERHCDGIMVSAT